MNLASEDLQSYVQLCHSVEPRCQSPGQAHSLVTYLTLNFFYFIASPDLAPFIQLHIYTMYYTMHILLIDKLC